MLSRPHRSGCQTAGIEVVDIAFTLDAGVPAAEDRA